jgi:gamma-glutamyltranspeptidase/glutathione hydrolase
MTTRTRTLLLVATVAVPAALLALLAETGPVPPAPDPHYVEAGNGVVVTVSGPATDVGVTVLRRGGNAVDAAVAVAFALSASYPPAGNIAGGGFMVVHPAPGDGLPVAIDFRECAPAAATPTMFGRDESQYTHRAVAVPGTVRGLAEAHRRYGTLPWAELVAPAVAIARDGFTLDPNLAGSMNDYLAAIPTFPEFQRVFGKPGGGKWVAGDRLVQPDLARTLQALADLGPDAFYTGPVAAGLLAEIARGKGHITAADLAGYQAHVGPALQAHYRGYDVYVPPPPSSGGVVLVEELNTLANFDLTRWGRWSPETVHVMAEAMRRANADRARYLGDPAFVSIPPKLTDPAYGRELARSIDLTRATPSRELAGGIDLTEGDSTTQFSVIDARGTAVSCTYTLERRWGSRIVVRGMGFLLNNDMWAFNLYPGRTDTTGTIGTPPNTIAPGKRPLSSMTPTVVARDGRVVLVTGSPGSRAIPHTVLNILVSVLDFGEPVRTAVEADRFSHQWFPDHVSLENPDRHSDLVRGLTERGHAVVKFGPLPQGDAHTIWVRGPNQYVGVADRRINGRAGGY